MTKHEVLDLYFADARSKLIDLAAFLDRLERADGLDDFRATSFRAALTHLNSASDEKARAVLLTLSDPTTEPIAAASTKSATGAWPQFSA